MNDDLSALIYAIFCFVVIMLQAVLIALVAAGAVFFVYYVASLLLKLFRKLRSGPPEA